MTSICKQRSAGHLERTGWLDEWMDKWMDGFRIAPQGYFVHVVISLLPSAIYLCKRTMQNKARLELADYEAVSLIIFQDRCGRRAKTYLQLCVSFCFSFFLSLTPFRQWKGGNLFCFSSFFSDP